MRAAPGASEKHEAEASKAARTSVLIVRIAMSTGGRSALARRENFLSREYSPRVNNLLKSL